MLDSCSQCSKIMAKRTRRIETLVRPVLKPALLCMPMKTRTVAIRE